MDRRRMLAAVALPLRPARSRSRHWILVLASLCPGAVLAQTHFTPYANGTYEYDTNFFAIANGVPQPEGSNGPTRAVGFETYKAGFESAYDWGLQEFFANAEGRRVDYGNFGELNHDEYTLDAGLRWKLASVLDGTFEYDRARTQVSYLLFNATAISYTQLYLQVQSVGNANINLQLSPEWRLETQGKINDLDSPRPGYPNLTVEEDSVTEGLKYVGFANLSAGLVAGYLDGRFTSGEFLVTPKYHQYSGSLAADYSLSGLSLFHGAVGYTNRNLEQAGKVSALTGVISYERDLTAKTSVNVTLIRALNVYVTAAAPEIDTSGEIDALWKATAKIGVSVGYQYMHSSIGATDIIDVVAPARTDRLQTPTLQVKYQALDWLSLRPYIQYRSRQSSFAIYSFTGVQYGVELEARFGPAVPLTLARPQ